MVPLHFFDNVTIAPPPYSVESISAGCPPWSNIVWVGREEGASFEKKKPLSSSNKGDSENIKFSRHTCTFAWIVAQSSVNGQTGHEKEPCLPVGQVTNEICLPHRKSGDY